MAVWKSTLLTCTLAAGAAWAQPRPPQPVSPPAVVWNTAPQSGSYLGVGVVEVNQAAADRLGMERARGVEIASVAPNSPAAEAGLQKGDVIVRFRDQEIEGVEQFARLVRETPVGREAALVVFSASGERSLNVSIGSRGRIQAPPEAQWPRFQAAQPSFDLPRTVMVTRNGSLGAVLEALDGQLAEYFGVEQGVLVREVEADSAADEAGLQAGDVIVSIDGASVDRPNELRFALARPGAGPAELGVMRNRERVTLQVETRQAQTGRRPLRTRSVGNR